MKKRRRRNSQFVHIGDIVEKVISNCRYEPDSRLSQIWDVWNTAVGKQISLNAKPAAIKGSVLLVHVTGAAWLHQLRFLKDDMMVKVNQQMGAKVIRDIKFKIGPI